MPLSYLNMALQFATAAKLLQGARGPDGDPGQHFVVAESATQTQPLELAVIEITTFRLLLAVMAVEIT